jgi:hypothetical protein
LRRCGDGPGIGTESLQNGPDDTFVLPGQGQQQVQGLDFRMVRAGGQLLGLLERLTGFDRESVHSHGLAFQNSDFQ